MAHINEIKKIAERVLDNRATAREADYIDRWLREDADLGAWMQEQMAHCSPEMPEGLRRRILHEATGGVLPAAGDSADAAAQVAGSAAPKIRFGRKAAVGLVAAIAVVFVACLYLLGGELFDDIATEPLRVYADAGMRPRLTLPDRSRVTLNSQSTLSYGYDSDSRRRTCELDGEALFDVATDADHPFVVTCNGLTVECRGTSFNVKAYHDEDHITVVLRDGSIVANNGTETIEMTPGTAVSFDRNSRRMESHPVDPSDYCSWPTGLMRFNHDRLGDILRALSRKYGVHINVSSPGLLTEPFTGTIGDGSLEQALDIVTAASDTRYTLRGDVVNISR